VREPLLRAPDAADVRANHATRAAASTPRRVIHNGWGKWRTPAGELLLRVDVQHPACWGSRGRRPARWRRKRVRAWVAPANAHTCLTVRKPSTHAAGPLGAGDELAPGRASADGGHAPAGQSLRASPLGGAESQHSPAPGLVL